MAEAQRAGLRGEARIDWATLPAAFRQVDPMLVLNPPDDGPFVALARSAYLAGARTPEALQRILRAVYPDAVVRRRDLADEVFVAWYVYRDGHWTPRGSTGPDRP